MGSVIHENKILTRYDNQNLPKIMFSILPCYHKLRRHQSKFWCLWFFLAIINNWLWVIQFWSIFYGNWLEFGMSVSEAFTIFELLKMFQTTVKNYLPPPGLRRSNHPFNKDLALPMQRLVSSNILLNIVLKRAQGHDLYFHLYLWFVI